MQSISVPQNASGGPSIIWWGKPQTSQRGAYSMAKRAPLSIHINKRFAVKSREWQPQAQVWDHHYLPHSSHYLTHTHAVSAVSSFSWCEKLFSVSDLGRHLHSQGARWLGPLPLLSAPPLPLEVGPLNLARGSGERCKLPQWGLGGRAPAEIEFGAFWL